MTQTAFVTEVIGNKACIQVKRVSACAHNCEQCGGGCSEMMKSAPVSVMAKNPLGAKPGDKVIVASDTGSILSAAAVVYLLPIVLFFVGYFAAQAFGAGEGVCIASGGACFALAMVLIIIFDRQMKRRSKEMFSIVEICRD